MPIANMQDATEDADEDCTITSVETRHGPTCNIDGGPLFDESLLEARQASGTATRLARTPTRRTSCYAMLGCTLASIPFPVPSKREVDFGGGSSYTSMSIGSSSPITLRVIAMMSPFQIGGASFNWSATIFVAHSRT
jgi:hypothetical protein